MFTTNTDHFQVGTVGEYGSAGGGRRRSAQERGAGGVPRKKPRRCQGQKRQISVPANAQFVNIHFLL